MCRGHSRGIIRPPGAIASLSGQSGSGPNLPFPISLARSSLTTGPSDLTTFSFIGRPSSIPSAELPCLLWPQ